VEQRRAGDSGPRVSVIGLGCNNFGMKLDREASVDVVHAALDTGITHFDTAEIYGVNPDAATPSGIATAGRSEEFLGEGLDGHRDDVVIATKFAPRPSGLAWEPGQISRRIREGCEASLRRLRTDRIDLYYPHWLDPEAPIDETLLTLADLVQEGKVIQVGCTHVENEGIDEAAETSVRLGAPAFVVTQVEWSLLTRRVETTVLPAARRHHLGSIPYFALASGLLAGKYRKGEEYPAGSRIATMRYFAGFATDENFAYVDALTAFAEERGHSIMDLAIGWLLAHDDVCSVLTGATTADQVRANADAAEAWMLTAEEFAAVPRPGPGVGFIRIST
jgi:aryl-alcohol dehydrogenase-like predicted oxidoreductase